MKFIALPLACLLLAVACTSEPKPAPTPSRTITQTPACPQAIDNLAEPLPETEVFLDAVALPTREVLQPNPSGEPDWLFAKFGLLVRATRTVTLTVDPSAAEWARIGWSDLDYSTELTIPVCSGTDSRFRVYAGGYEVRSGPRCLPLIVRSGDGDGDGTARARISVGVAC
ncbi:MAG TPA: hypothetical protein VF062_00300 [Candidatus Limnocylindrales bacterium]